MTIRVALNHKTAYHYDKPIQLAPHTFRLRPAAHSRTPVTAYSLKILPENHFISWQQDPFGNYLARVVFPEKSTELSIEVDLIAEMTVINPFDFFLEEYAENYPFAYPEQLLKELAPYLEIREKGLLLTSWLAEVDTGKKAIVDFLVYLNQRVNQTVNYSIRMEVGVQTCEETLEKKLGSCRDSAWLLVQALRHMGLAARFVSGYLVQLTADVKSLDGPSGTDKDFTDLHAWTEVYIPGAGWIGLDPTSGLLAGEGHIPLACTADFVSAAPVTGAVDKCEVEFSHHMEVTRIYESPRVTMPYTDEQWARVLALGEAVDAELVAGDVRLTQGGEPTYVATDDREGAEWNTDALGPTKRAYATELVHKLRDEYGQGGFLHFGQGKWYPGEQLPRWALSICWRADGQPVWNNPALFADERVTAHYTAADAQRFTSTLAGKLGMTDQYIEAGYEDTWYYLWRERRLPVNVDPFNSKLDDEMERVRLRRVFDQKLDSVVGYVLPLDVNPDADNPAMVGPRWQTGPWFFRDERMYLIPGDSPMGYRLPLDSLPWVSSAEYPYMVETDPMAPRSALPAAQALHSRYASGSTDLRGVPYLAGTASPGEAQRRAQGLGSGQVGQNGQGDGDAATQPGQPQPGRWTMAPARGTSAHWITRTALCVEARNPARANGPKVEAAS